MKYQTRDSAACDLESTEYAIVPAGEIKVISTGIYLSQFGAIPEDMCFLVLSRSGLAAKHGVQVYNSPGLIDRDYLGEIKVILHNASMTDFVVHPGDRIAQLMAVNFLRIPGVEVSDKVREGGLGSTGG